MPRVELLIVFLAAVVVLAGVGRRLRAPHPVAMVLGGLAAGLLPGIPAVTLEPDVVFFVFLPPLAYAAAYAVSPEALGRQARPIALLATGLVVLTMGGVACAGHWIAGLAWTPAFVLGAVLGPTDPVAATAVMRRVGAPERLSTILQGEALVNDGTGLAVFKIALVAAAGQLSAGGAAGRFLELAAGGIAVGVGISWLVAQIRRRMDDPEIEITLAIVSAYASYALADRLGFSGVLAAVSAGLYARRSSDYAIGPATRMESGSFWGVATFILESLLFLLIGLQLPELINGGQGVGGAQAVGYGAAVAGRSRFASRGCSRSRMSRPARAGAERACCPPGSGPSSGGRGCEVEYPSRQRSRSRSMATPASPSRHARS